MISLLLFVLPIYVWIYWNEKKTKKNRTLEKKSKPLCAFSVNTLLIPGPLCNALVNNNGFMQSFFLLLNFLPFFLFTNNIFLLDFEYVSGFFHLTTFFKEVISFFYLFCYTSYCPYMCKFTGMEIKKKK